MAQASRGAPVREARHETSASKGSPRKPSRDSDAGSVTLPKRNVAPPGSDSARRARVRTKQTT